MSKRKIENREDSIKKGKDHPQQRMVFLITYSQANLTLFPTSESFGQEVAKAFGGEKLVKEWACCIEDHANGGKHFHMSIKFFRSQRFKPVKKYFMKKFNVSLHFKMRSIGYVAAYKYVCKQKPVDQVAHSVGHTPMSDIRTPKTKKAMLKYSINSQAKRKKGESSKGKQPKRRLDFYESDDSSSDIEGDRDEEQEMTNTEEELDLLSESEQEFMPPRLNQLEVGEFCEKHNIRSREELLYFGNKRAENGQKDLKRFLLSHPKKFVNEIIASTWELKEAGPNIDRMKKTRMELLAEALQGQCHESCVNREWLRCAVSTLATNGINVLVFAAAMRKALKKGRAKWNNILIVGPKTCGKTFLLAPLQYIFKAFVNPSNTKYAWVDLEGKEVALLNDFRWTSECIDWNMFLLLLEGDTVNLPRPKNVFATDLTIATTNKVPFFATSIRPFEYIGKANSRDEGETAMMATRWVVFTLSHQIKNPNTELQPCPRCFADLLSKGQEYDPQ